jgi:hypothetical protein
MQKGDSHPIKIAIIMPLAEQRDGGELNICLTRATAVFDQQIKGTHSRSHFLYDILAITWGLAAIRISELSERIS